uniref:Uncharacterized protein n=1 Tax=viral metagenome TaxID=1070528 RepID=A0A6C0KUN2_9ZZZZ
MTEIERPLPLYLSPTDIHFHSTLHSYPTQYHLQLQGVPCSRFNPIDMDTFLKQDAWQTLFYHCAPTKLDRNLLFHLHDELYDTFKCIMPSIYSSPPSILLCDSTNQYVIAICSSIIIIADRKTDSIRFLYHGAPICSITKKSKMYSYKQGHTILEYCIKDNTIRGKISDLTKKQDVTICMEPDQIRKSYTFHNVGTGTRVLSHLTNDAEKMVVTENKNGLLIHTTRHHATGIEKLISRCMMTDSSGIRYRGTYTQEKKDGNVTKKTLSKDNLIVYNQEDGEVLINTIKRGRPENEMMIGWKVAKSESGEHRIIKLGIPVDAMIVSPITYEFFHKRGKQRCDKAIVMDIQYPSREEEESVVPHEMIAYSYLHTGDTPFPYRVGSLVTPDAFDLNENECCTQGIHFYEIRMDIFETYLADI